MAKKTVGEIRNRPSFIVKVESDVTFETLRPMSKRIVYLRVFTDVHRFYVYIRGESLKKSLVPTFYRREI